MRIQLRTDGGVPYYQQIVDQVKFLVASGRLVAGDELPAIRTLAEQLVINPNTVARAYRELEQGGVVTSRAGAGTRVTDKGSPLARKERLRLLCEHVDALLATGDQLGFSLDDILAAMRKRHDGMQGK